MANDPVETVPLGYGLTLACSFPDLDAVEVAISFLNRRLVCHRFSAKERGAPHRFDLGLVRFEIGISANMFDGEVTLTCGAEIRKALGSAWHRVFKGERRIRFDPSIGEVAGRTEAAPPLNSPGPLSVQLRPVPRPSSASTWTERSERCARWAASSSG